MLKSKRIVVISDSHCGHRAGLTPPEYQYPIIKNPSNQTIKDRNKYGAIQREMWNWYVSTIKKLGPIDTLFHLGDAIDGNALKNEGTEEIIVDQIKQCDMAVDVINVAKAKNIIMIRGTPYHTGKAVDFEDIIAEKVGAKKIGSHEWISFCNGKLTFDLKHKIGNTTVLYSHGTSIAKEQLWNSLWAERDLQPKAQILIRGHIHRDFYVGDSEYLGITLPGLQWSTNYGTRDCVARVSVGLVIFDIFPNGSYTWNFEIARLPIMKTTAIQL